MEPALFAALGALCTIGCTTSDRPSHAIDGVAAEAPGFQGIVLIGDTDGLVHRYVRQPASGARYDDGDVWRWASVSKQIIATVVMQEVDAGRLSLDDTLASRLPEADVPRAGDITIRDLLQHTSGLPQPERLASEEGELLPLCTTDLQSEPGQTFLYNNCDTILAGAILERLTGEPLDVLLSERIFEPAGMASARLKTFGSGGAEDVTGYLSGEEPEPGVDVAAFWAAGGVVGEPVDLVRFSAALMRGDLLSEEARETMWTGEPKFGYAALGQWAFTAPLAGCKEPVRLVERRGHIEGVQVRNIIARDIERSLVVFTNRGDFAFGEIWMQEGFSYDLASAAFCTDL